MEEEKFSSMASFNVISDNGSIDFHFGPGIVAVKTKATVFSVDNLSQTVTYINELLDFEIRGQVNGMDFVLREDPDKESTGRTTVQGLGGDTFTGPFRIDSFFDVFMELQLGNLPFKDCVPGGIGNACGRVVLVPEPTTLALCGAALGLLGLARRRKAA